MSDYLVYGYDKYLRRTDALRTDIVTSVDFETKYEVQNNKLNASKVNLGSLVKRAGTASGLGTFNITQALNLTSSITYKTPKSDIRTFGKPIIGIYQGNSTANADQIYPIRGTNVTLGRYDVIGGELDFGNNDSLGYNGTSDQWRAMIVDTNGTSSQVILFVTDWIYIDYVTGNAV